MAEKFVRASSGAVINNDKGGLAAYKRQKQTAARQEARIQALEAKLETVCKQIEELRCQSQSQT